MSLERFRKHEGKPDYFLILLIFILLIFGLIMIYSASSWISTKTFGYASYYLNKQAAALAIGLVVWFIFSQIDYRFWEKWAMPALLITLILLIAVFLPGVGSSAKGAARWLILGSQSFQPSELCKLTLVIYLSSWLSRRGEKIKDFQSGFLPFAIIVGLIAFLIIKEPDMGTMSIITMTAAIMFFVAGASWQYLMLGAVSIASFFLILIKAAPYRMQRLTVFLNPSKEGLDASYHINQALLAIGSGGLLGRGFGQSIQKYFYLPEVHTDSIFAIITEELGFIRSSLVIIAFMLIAWRGYNIAKKAPDGFSRLLAAGITSWIIFQAAVNFAAILGLMPLTGVPLPFISYGGSSLVILLAAVGVLVNISKHTAK